VMLPPLVFPDAANVVAFESGCDLKKKTQKIPIEFVLMCNLTSVFDDNFINLNALLLRGKIIHRGSVNLSTCH
jgi:hypothetical protein